MNLQKEAVTREAFVHGACPYAGSHRGKYSQTLAGNSPV